MGSIRKKGSNFFNPRSYFKSGSYNVWCPVCDFAIKREKALLRWDNVLVCRKCWDPYNPNDVPVKTPKSENDVPFDARPAPDDVFKYGTEEEL